jgi:carbon monoxide dehydrogenase subunit G
MPDIEQSFTIDQPIERVWDFFQDVPQVVTCMPGLEFTGSTGAASYGGKVRVKLGPIAAAFQGEATIVETDAAQRRARLEAKGIDRQGGNRAQASVTYELTPAGTGTAVRLYGDIKLAGALAQMGRSGIVQDVAAELTRQFAEALRAKLAAGAGAAGAPAAPRALGGGRLLWQLVWHRVRSLFARLFRA